METTRTLQQFDALNNSLRFDEQDRRYQARPSKHHFTNCAMISDSLLDNCYVLSSGVVVLHRKGDFFINVGTERSLTLQVSKKRLQESSEFFRAGLGTAWSRPDAFSTADQPLVLSDDDPFAMIMLMRVLIFNVWQFTSDIVPELRRLLIVAEKYMCNLTDRFPPGMESFVRDVVGRSIVHSRQLCDATVVAYYAEYPAEFAVASRALLFTKSPRELFDELYTNSDTDLDSDLAAIFLDEYRRLRREFARTFESLRRERFHVTDPRWRLPEQASLLGIVSAYTQMLDPDAQMNQRFVGNDYFQFQKFVYNSAMPNPGRLTSLLSRMRQSRLACDEGKYIAALRDLNGRVCGLCLGCVHEGDYTFDRCATHPVPVAQGRQYLFTGDHFSHFGTGSSGVLV